MAVDDAILESYASCASVAPATLRLYGWSPPAVSLGRSQRFERACDPEFLHAEGIGLVRRPTGGLAVLHEFERTYSFCAELRTPPFGGGVLETYERIAEALGAAMRTLGVKVEVVSPSSRAVDPARSGDPSCFQLASAHEIAVGGAKLIGSAQVRRRGAFLQHGTILLRADPLRLGQALGSQPSVARFTDLETVLGGVPELATVDRALVARFEAVFGIHLACGELTPVELERATRLYAWKHCSLAWVREGRVGEREKRWGPAGIS